MQVGQAFDSSGFLSCVHVERAGPGQVLLTARYDIPRFSQDLYKQANVAFPMTLERSVPKRRSEYLAGRALARFGMKELGCLAAQVERGAHGEPHWPAGVSGSISHSHGYVGVWMTTQAWSPGLDIEHMPEPSGIEAIRAGVMTGKEAASNVSDRDAVTLFSAKEALYKGLFPSVGARFGFHAAELVASPGAGVIQLRLTRTLTSNLTKGSIFDVSFDWSEDRVMTRFKGPAVHPRSA